MIPLAKCHHYRNPRMSGTIEPILIGLKGKIITMAAANPPLTLLLTFGTVVAGSSGLVYSTRSDVANMQQQVAKIEEKQDKTADAIQTLALTTARLEQQITIFNKAIEGSRNEQEGQRRR